MQARIHHRRRLVDAAANARDNPVDDGHQVPLVVEPHRRKLELAAALDEHLIRTVHQNVRDGGIVQQLLQRAEAEDLVLYLLDDSLPRRNVEGHRVLRHQQLAGLANLLAGCRILQGDQQGQVQHLDHALEDGALPLLLGTRQPGSQACAQACA